MSGLGGGCVLVMWGRGQICIEKGYKGHLDGAHGNGVQGVGSVVYMYIMYV